MDEIISSGWAVFVDSRQAFAARGVTREEAVAIVRRHYPDAHHIETRAPIQATVLEAMGVGPDDCVPWITPGTR